MALPRPLSRRGRVGNGHRPVRFSIWRLWTPSHDVRAGRAVAAAVPIAYWAPFFVATGVPGAGVEDAPHLGPRVAGVPSNLLGAAATTLTAAAGWLLDRRLRPA
jgi:hypothetical protein